MASTVSGSKQYFFDPNRALTNLDNNLKANISAI